MFLYGNEPKDIISKSGSLGVFPGNGSPFFYKMGQKCIKGYAGKRDVRDKVLSNPF